MEGRVDVIRTGPRLVDRRIGAQHVVVGQDVGEAKLLDALPERADSAAIWSDLGLRKYDANIHE